MSPKELTERTIQDVNIRRAKRIEEGKKQADIYQREKKSKFKHIRSEYK